MASPSASPGSYAILRGSDVARIRESIARGPSTAEVEERRQQEVLHKRSQERVAKWQDTFDAQRKRKDRAAQEKRDREEAARVELDEEEARIQGAARSKIIERANQLLLENTEPMRELQSKALMSDVLKEREAQIEVRRKIEQMHKEQDQRWLQQQAEQLKAEDEREQQKARDAYDKQMEVAKAHREQLMEYQKRIMHERKLADEERIASLEHAARTAREEREEKEMRLRKARELTEETMRFNELSLSIQRQEKERAMQEEIQHQKHVEKKERLDQLKREQEQKVTRRKQEQQSKLIERQINAMIDRESIEKARLEKQQVEFEEARVRKEEADDERVRQQKQKLKESWEWQLAQKQKRKQKELEEQRQFQQQYKDNHARFSVEEDEENRVRRQHNKDVLRFVQEQAQEKEALALEQKTLDLMEDVETRDALAREDEAFREYAEMYANEVAGEGKSPAPFRRLKRGGLQPAA